MDYPPIAALDIGTTKIRVVVGEVRENQHLVLLGSGECASRGLRKSEVVDFDMALSCVRNALQIADERTGVSVAQVYLNVSGGHIQSLIHRGSIPLLGNEDGITRDDIDHVMEAARAVNLPGDRDLLHSICQHFYVDDQQGVMNPNGMEGSKLALDMLIVHGNKSRLKNAIKLAKSVPVDVQDVAFSGLCSALAVLSPEEKEMGAVVIDLGGGTTDFVAYANGAIAAAGSLAVGGDHVTNDIARGLNVPVAYAERLKETHGSALMDLALRSQRLDLSYEGYAGNRYVRLGDLHTIVAYRMEEILAMVRAQMEDLGILHHLGAGVVLTGGGAFLKNTPALAEKVFGLSCTMGKPHDVSGQSFPSGGADFAAAVGMLKYAMKASRKDTPSINLSGFLKNLFGRS